MKAIAVYPGQKNSVHLADLPMPSLDEIPDGRGVLVRVLRCGVDGTDKEINAAEYGAAPDGYDFLTIGHENFGRVEAVGPNVAEFQPGDYVVATVRRRGSSIYDRIGTYDMTTDEIYFERGVSRRHGYLTEFYVDDPEYIVKVPAGLRDIAVIAEPLSVPEKGIIQAFDDAWNSIAPDFGGNPLAIEAARLKLANVILAIAQNDRSNPEQIKRAALQIMAKDDRTGAI